MTPATDREHDLVIYGATGFVGKLTAIYLADAAPEGTKIAFTRIPDMEEFHEGAVKPRRTSA